MSIIRNRRELIDSIRDHNFIPKEKEKISVSDRIYGWKRRTKKRITDAFEMERARIARSLLIFIDDTEISIKRGKCNVKRLTSLIFLGKPSFDEPIYLSDEGVIWFPPQPEHGRVIKIWMGQDGCWSLRSKWTIYDYVNVLSRAKRAVRDNRSPFPVLFVYSSRDKEWTSRNVDSSDLLNPEQFGEEQCYFDRLGIEI